MLYGTSEKVVTGIRLDMWRIFIVVVNNCGFFRNNCGAF